MCSVLFDRGSNQRVKLALRGGGGGMEGGDGMEKAVKEGGG